MRPSHQRTAGGKQGDDGAVGAYRGVKIHLLHVLKGTALAALYQSGGYVPLGFDEHVDVAVSQLEVLPPETVIERITGDGDRQRLLAPIWSRDKIRVLGAIDRELAARNTEQGKLYLAEC